MTRLASRAGESPTVSTRSAQPGVQTCWARPSPSACIGGMEGGPRGPGSQPSLSRTARSGS
eukprot:5714490-Lingulodinium_polyedra.AAC.1